MGWRLTIMGILRRADTRRRQAQSGQNLRFRPPRESASESLETLGIR